MFELSHTVIVRLCFSTYAYLLTGRPNQILREVRYEPSGEVGLRANAEGVGASSSLRGHSGFLDDAL